MQILSGQVAESEQYYARFLEAQGLRVLEADGALWVEKRRFFLENIPPHRKLRLTNGGVNRLFLRGAAAVRYTCDESDGQHSFEYICSEKNFSVESLSADARRRTRRGLELCEIRPIDFDLLADCGCSVNRSTLARQGRSGVTWVTDETLWKKYMRACKNIPTVEAFGAFVDGRFVGYSMSVIVNEYSYLHHTQAYTEDLKHSPINALTFTVTREMLRRENIQHVSQGLESFASLPDVERFKLSMGFRKKTLGRRVVVNPILKPIFHPVSAWLIKNTIGLRHSGAAEDFATFTDAIRARTRTTGVSSEPARK
jgi:hypothetical protein